MLPQRVAAAVVGIPVIIGLTLARRRRLFAVAAGFVLTFAALEFYVTTDPELAASGADPQPARTSACPASSAPPASPSSSPPADNGFDWWARALTLSVVLPFLPLILRGQTATRPPRLALGAWAAWSTSASWARTSCSCGTLAERP